MATLKTIWGSKLSPLTNAEGDSIIGVNMETKELINELNDRLEDIELAKTKPGHGVCCTCQECGHFHDDCTCYDEKITREVIRRLVELEELGRSCKRLIRIWKDGSWEDTISLLTNIVREKK